MVIAGVLTAPASAQELPPLLIPPALKSLPEGQSAHALPQQSKDREANKTSEPVKVACTLTLLQPAGVIKMLPSGGQRVLKFKRNTVGPCLQAAVTDAEWLTVQVDSKSDEVILEFEANTEVNPRNAKVSIASLSRSFTIQIQQAADQSLNRDRANESH